MSRAGPEGERIGAVAPGSLAAEAGLEPGDRVLAINGRPPRDAIDFRFQSTEPLVELEVVHAGELGVVEFEKPTDEALGIEFGAEAFGGTSLCNNKCFFCFLKGLPKGLRKPLYVKDDDYRLSFLHGNFVTLTNLTEDDWERLAEQRLSPLNVSVHATDPTLRREMLGNPRAPDVRAQIRRLAEMGIAVQTQVVLCPGVNDGAALDETIGELLGHANVDSIGVVPVGNSVDGEARIQHGGMRAHSAAEARRTVNQISRWQRRSREAGAGARVFASDELYLTAGARIPSAARYEGFPQYENGVGMTRSLLDDWARTRRRIRRGGVGPSRYASATLACGTLIAPTLRRLAGEAGELLGTRLDVVAVPNTLFGGRVNVSGLIPGGDFVAALSAPGAGDARASGAGDAGAPGAGDAGAPGAGDAGAPGALGGGPVFLPRASLDYYGRHFLDDMTAEELGNRLGRAPVFVYTLGEVVEWLTADGEVEPLVGRNARSNGQAWSSEAASGA